MNLEYNNDYAVHPAAQAAEWLHKANQMRIYLLKSALQGG